MRRVIVGWILALVAIVGVAASASVQSATQTKPSNQQTKPKGRPSLYIFSIQGCQPCQRLANEGLTDAEVVAMIERMEYKKVDMALTPNARELHRTHARSGGVPELVLYDGEGRLIGRQVGYETIDTLIEFLRKAFSQEEIARIKAESRTRSAREVNDNTN